MFGRLFAAGYVALVLLAFALPAGSAAVNKTLQRVSGNVSYRLSSANSQRIGGQVALPDNAFALTENRSTARVTLEDSSVVGLGQNTTVLLGAFNSATAGPGSTITVNGGRLRFEIHHPAGAKSNYTFVTPTAQIAVRGTIGLISTSPTQDVVVCLSCAPGDVEVRITATGEILHLISNDALTISSGVGKVGQVNQQITKDFENDGLNAGVGGGGGTFSGVLADVRPIGLPNPGVLEAVGGAIVGGAVILSSQPTHAPNATPTPGGGTIVIQGRPTPAPTPH